MKNPGLNRGSIFMLVSHMWLVSCFTLMADTDINDSGVDVPNIVHFLESTSNALVANSSLPMMFFSNELAQLKWANLLLRAIKVPKMVLTNEIAYHMSGFYMLFPNLHSHAEDHNSNNYYSYKKTFSQKLHWKSKFLLVWPKVSTQNELKEVFAEFWHHNYPNVIGLMDVGSGRFEFYSFSPYGENKCSSVGEPFVLDEWSWNVTSEKFVRQHRHQQDLFPRRIRNFGGCPLKVIGNHQPPDNVMELVNGEWRADGVGSKVLEMARQYLNFTSIIVPTARANTTNLEHMWYYFDEELRSITEAVHTRKVNFAFGWYSYVSIAIDHLDLTMELGRVSSIDCFGWAVPYRAGKKPPNYSLYVCEFEIVTWGLVIITLCAMCVVFYTSVVNHRHLIPSLLLSYKAFLEQPLDHRLHRLGGFRVAFASFCFYSLVMSAAYKASFSSFWSVPFHGKEFVTVKEILNSSLQIHGAPEMLKILRAMALQTNNGEEVIRRFQALQPCNFESVMVQMIRERNIAVLGVKRNLYYHSLNEAKQLKVKIPVRFLPGCLIRPHSTHFMFRRGSHLIEPFNVVLNRLFESGVIPRWILHLGSNRILPVERLKGRTMPLRSLKEPFVILIIGYLVSCLAFGAEIVYCRAQKGKNNDNRI